MERTHKKGRITLRQKMVMSIFLVYAILTSYFLYFTAVKEHQAVEKEAIKAAEEKMGLISAYFSQDSLPMDEKVLKALTNQLLKGRDIDYILVVDRQGRVLAEQGAKLEHRSRVRGPAPQWIGPGEAEARVPPGRRVYQEERGPIAQKIGEGEGVLHKSGHHFNLRMPLVHEGTYMGEVHFGVNTKMVNQRLARATYHGLSIIVITLLTGSLLTYLLERRLRGSVKNLIGTTRRIARGDLTQRVDMSVGDEVEELGESINQMAEALAEKEKQLITGKNRMINMFNGITAGIAYISEDYRIIHANRAYTTLLREKSEVFPMKGLRCFEDLWHRHEPCNNCPGEAALKSGKSKELEVELLLKNGERRVLWIHAYPVQKTPGNPGGFVEYVMDVTRQKKLEEELKSYTEHLEELTQEREKRLKEAQVQMVHQEKMAALGQMAAGVAHEIGNPLSALASLIRALETELRNNGSDGKKIRSMKEQVDRICKIVREMMDFSRPASTRKTLTDANLVIQSALGISSYDKRLKKVQVVTRLDREIPALKVDGDQLLQVFLNIIFNAADAMNGKGTLTVTSMPENGSVFFLFKDTGPGIPAHLLSRIFEPFFTTKRVGEGTGLGLSVSYGIVQSMGGVITASNRKEGGSIFTVKIPLYSASEGSHKF